MDEPFTELDSEAAAQLLENQHHLQAEAAAVLTDLDLFPLLGRIGEAQPVGSVVTGLMAWRDIDVDVICDPLDPVNIWAALTPLAAHPRVKKLWWSNERGPLCTTHHPDLEGYYLGIHCLASDPAASWKVDCWFVPADAPRPDIAMTARLAREMTDEQRIAILWIKGFWAARPEYRRNVFSVDIYAAVLDHGVRSPEGFTAWLRARNQR